MVLAAVDPLIATFEAQPLKVTYLDERGRLHTYTPDLQVTFSPVDGEYRRPLLIEVKYCRDLRKQREDNLPKFRAARALAEENGWDFRVLTERQIRTPFLKNAKFLNKFIHRESNVVLEKKLLDELATRQEVTVEDLAGAVTGFIREEALIALWRLISIRAIWTDLAVPLGLESVLRATAKPDATFLWGKNGPPLAASFLPPAEPVDQEPVPFAGITGEGAQLTARTLALTPGSLVMAGGRPATILRALDFATVLARDVSSGEVETFKIRDLRILEAVGKTEPPPPPDLVAVPDSAWETANQRLGILGELLPPGRDLSDVEGVAIRLNVHPSTVYRMLKRLKEQEGRVTALLPARKTGGKGKHRVAPAVETLLNVVINKEYLDDVGWSPSEVYKSLEIRCAAQDLAPPHLNTLRNRIADLKEALRLEARKGKAFADRTLRPSTSPFPDADHPFDVWQIDHTPVDVIIVDGESRAAIGRPYLTLVADVATRMVVGFYLSLDPPSVMSVGMALAMAVLPKHRYMAELAIEVEWPCWGVPSVILTDNGKEFRSDSFKRACEQYGITQEWRPAGQPHFGGHIESLIGTVMEAVHTIPGTTKSSIRERGDYNSEKHAVMTLAELERWLTLLIVGDYHQRPHRGLSGQAPIARYKEGLKATGRGAGMNLPPMITNEDRVRMDFLPSFERTLRLDGFELEGIRYYDDVLTTFLLEKGVKCSRGERTFILRRDPRDVSFVMMWDPKLSCYQRIPTRDRRFPKMSIWEWREARKSAKKRFKGQVDEGQVLQTRRELLELVGNAAKETQGTRKKAARKKAHQMVGEEYAKTAATGRPQPEKVIPLVVLPDEITPFEEAE